MGSFLLRICLSLLTFWIYISEAHALPGVLTYTSNSTLNFGNITKQTGLDVTSTVTPTSSNRGEILIKDSNSSTETINITFQSCGLTANKVRVKDFVATYAGQSWTVTGDGPFTQTGLTNPQNSGTKLQYGATMLVTKDATIGSLAPCYNISIQYDCANAIPKCTTASSVVANENANLLVIGAPFIINDVQSMDFKNIVKPTINSTVVMQPNGEMSITGNPVLLDGTIGQSAQFDIIAEKDVTVSISASGSSIVNGLQLSNITASFNNSSVQNINSDKTFTTSANGTNNLQIGATLNINATSATAGQYNLTYDITISYQ